MYDAHQGLPGFLPSELTAAGMGSIGTDTNMADNIFSQDADMLQGFDPDFSMGLDFDMTDSGQRSYSSSTPMDNNTGNNNNIQNSEDQQLLQQQLLVQQQQQQNQQHHNQRQYHTQNQNPNQQNIEDNNSGGINLMGEGMTGAGAGPLPTGFGLPINPSVGSTLTDFTKRRNWSQRVIEELKDFLHILTPDGRILYVSPSAKQLTGLDKEQLVGSFITDFIHPDDSAIFIREFNESIASGNTLRFFYRFRKSDNSYVIFEAHGHPHLTSEPQSNGLRNNAGFCRGFFMMSRPYPTKNAGLLDSFLEHKIENERLTQRIAMLRREEQEENDSHQATPHGGKERKGDTPSDQRGVAGGAATESETGGTASMTSAQSYDGMPPPAKPTISNTALTRQNLDEALASSKPDSINDKMARYEGATHLETIEMLTGLRYRDGERSQGISTGDASPALIKGDVGIAIPIDKDGRGLDKKKKLKVADEYVCTDCGTLDSPEWRKGPMGPKTLCNACGLRWAKKEKKRSGPLSGNGTPSTLDGSAGNNSVHGGINPVMSNSGAHTSHAQQINNVAGQSGLPAGIGMKNHVGE